MSARVLKYTLVVRHPETLAAEALVEGKPVPGWAKDLVHEDDLVSANDEAQGDGDETEVKPYAKWKKADLEAEVESRNTDRADYEQIVIGGKGTVPDLAEALDADDEAQGS